MGIRKQSIKYLCNKRRFGSGKVSFIAKRIADTLLARSVPNNCANFEQWKEIKLQEIHINWKELNKNETKRSLQNQNVWSSPSTLAPNDSVARIFSCLTPFRKKWEAKTISLGEKWSEDLKYAVITSSFLEIWFKYLHLFFVSHSHIRVSVSYLAWSNGKIQDRITVYTCLAFISLLT